MMTEWHRGIRGARHCTLLGLLLTAFLAVQFAPDAIAQNAKSASALTPPRFEPPTIIVGFLGGYVSPTSRAHGPVQFAERLREIYPSGVRIEVFENHKADLAEKAIVSFAHDARAGKFTSGAPSEPRVILYGHSWGAAATVSLARQLAADGVPVSLTVQIDSVAPHGINDALIPPNVAHAVNLYQSSGLLHGQPEIKAEDPMRTRILGNFRYDYEKQPVSCKGYPWWNRVFSKTHMEIECDPKVWSQVESVIRSEIEPAQARGSGN